MNSNRYLIQLVVMIGVRKSLDLIFTKYELKALDDLMPESHKKHKDEDDDEEVGLEVRPFQSKIELPTQTFLSTCL